MSKLKHNAEGYRTICILLVIVIAAILFGWHNSENARINQMEKLEDQIAEYEDEIRELKVHIETLEEELSEAL